MKLSVGDKVRVNFYPPASTQSFVEGIVEKTEVKTFDGLGFAMQMTREVIMGREAETKRTLPYITRYEKEDDFEGRIVVLEAASGSQPEPEAASEQVSEPAEVESVAETEDTIETEPAPAAEPYAAVEPEVEPVAETEAADQPDEQKRGWLKFFGRAA